MSKYEENVEGISSKRKIGRTLSKWRKRKKPADLKELSERIEEYFTFCDENGIQPGVEMLACCLGVTRQTLLRWTHGLHCTYEWASVCVAARQSINAYYEQALAQGTMPTVAAIFALKVSAGWDDRESFDDRTAKENIGLFDSMPMQTPLELLEKYTRLLEESGESTAEVVRDTANNSEEKSGAVGMIDRTEDEQP